MRSKGPRPDKVETVGRMKELLGQSKGTILTEYRGLTVAEITKLRGKLREVGGEYHVVKNTLYKIAIGPELTPEVAALFEGPTAIVFATDDPTVTAKALLDGLKEIKKPEVKVKAAVIDGKVYSAEQVVALSKIPPRPIVLGQVVGTLQAPLTGFAGTLNGVLSEFARTLQALTEKMESEAA